MSLLQPTGDNLMTWRESNAYVRKNFRLGNLIVMLSITVVALGVVEGIHYIGNPTRHFPFLLLLIFPIVALSFLGSWFSSGAQVLLNEDCIVYASGRYGQRSDYSEIASCTVRGDSYKSTKFSLLEFELKDKSKFRINSPVNRVAVPENVSLDQVLQIIRDRGVRVIDSPISAP